MKKIIVFFILCAAGLMCETLFAQIKINIVSQPLWGPVGYDYVEYYYIPEVDAYYYVPRREYIYMDNNRWITRSYLPRRYKGFDLYGATKYVINEPKPYLKHSHYKAKYMSSGKHSGQPSIRDSKDHKYFENKNHPEHSKWKSDNKKGGSKKGNKGKKNHR
jgi:hypothetical protein